MLLRYFLFFTAIVFCSTLIAQNFTGVWEGSFALKGANKNKINVRIEIIQKGNWVSALVSTRGFEKNTAYGCDYIVHGWFEKSNLILGLENVQRAIAITKKDCTSFNQIELSLNSKDSVNTAKGRWFWIDDSKEVFVLKKTATEISEIAREEIEEMTKRTSGPETKKIDQLKLNGKSVSITVRSVVKDPKAPLCAWINGNVLVMDFNLAKNGLVIKLDDIATINRLVFLNNSTTGESLEVKITFQQGRKKKEWVTSIDALGEVLLVLTYKKENLYSDRFPEFVSD